MAKRPEQKKFEKVIRLATAFDKGLRSAIDSKKKELVNLSKCADAFRMERLRSALMAMDVDILSQGKQGIRVSYLKGAGINDMYTLSRTSLNKLKSIGGIGEQNAQLIREMTEKIVINTRNTLRVRINADAPLESDLGLVRALYVFLGHETLRDMLSEAYDVQHPLAAAEIAESKLCGSAASWMFASEEKKTASLRALSSLIKRLKSRYGVADLVTEYDSVLKADRDAYMAHFKENAPLYYATLEKHCKRLDTGGQNLAGLPEEILAEIEAEVLDLSGLKAELREYQTFGVKYIVNRKRVLLGDEMGLGKTIEAIASMVALKARGLSHFMVVCPASVLINWQREIEKFSDLAVTIIHGNDAAAVAEWIEKGDVAVTTYESISRFALPDEFLFDMVVVDEAHYVKNPAATRTVAMLDLLRRVSNALYMTGTPLVNNVDEMCFLISSLQPEMGDRLNEIKTISTADQFRQEIAPVYLRRVRDDVLGELPELIEKEQWCTLSPLERELYRKALASENFMAVRRVSWDTEAPFDSSKACRLVELCDTAREQGRKIIVFSFFRKTLETVQHLLIDRASEIISGDISPDRRQAIIDTFNAALPGAVLVSQVQAGGTGLNIQAASVIIFCEPQLTPAIENQAIARAYRMGQVSDVLVYRLLAADTIDERMLEMLARKQRDFDNYADDSVIADEEKKAATEGTNSWLIRTIKEEKERLRGEDGDTPVEAVTDPAADDTALVNG